MLGPAAPISKETEATPKKPAAAMVTTENKSVIRPIHLEVIFWLTVVTIECF